MLIPINKKYRLTSDAYNIIVEERRVSGSTGKKVKNPGQEYWTPVSYHPTVEQAVKSLLQREIKLSDALGIYALIDSISKLQESVLKTLRESQKV